MATVLRVVRVENGDIQGLPAADPRITSFKGIPFAAPPVGDNRWRAPQPVRDWDGTLQAFAFSPIPMQAKTVIDVRNIYTREWAVDPDIAMSEDCLYLNVWTPARSPAERLPVYVWYFGGGLQTGHTAEMEFDGERIARRGIVVVTINYRLNVFGFLCHPEITQESPAAPANFGHLDQLAGTRWVQRNIAAFGGDPGNITIGGQSAGGASVLCHLTSPQTAGLFQKAIIQSGFFTRLYSSGRMPGSGRTLEEAEREGVRFFDFLGVPSLAAARRLDAGHLRDRSREYRGYWGTIVDGVYSVGNAFELFLQDKGRTVPVLCGHTSSEFFSTPNSKTMDEFRAMAVDMFGADADVYLALCRGEPYSLEEVRKCSSVSGIEYAIRLAGQAGEANGARAPLYYYNFDADIPGWDAPGTFHSVDLWFFFETLAKCWRPFVGRHYDLARWMCNYWANFIRNGDPNGQDATGLDLPRWEPYTVAAPHRMEFRDELACPLQPPSDLMRFLVSQYFKRQALG